ncbi:MAG: glycosyltransferase family 1 protein [Candidatus Omnitrophota bacterium]|jgi:glycosyltransferase involved in cell wall biosynthesis
MKIAIDAQPTVGSKTGIGYYVYNLLKEYASLENNEIIFYRYTHPRKEELNTLERMYWENILLNHQIQKEKIDILHIPGFAGPIKKGKFKKVTTVHDLIGMIYPQNLSFFSRFYWQKWLPVCVKNSDFIIADSENTKKDIIRFLHIPEERIKVVYLAASPKFSPLEKSAKYEEILKQYGIENKYFLNVGTIEPRKNISLLIEGFWRYLQASQNKDIILVIAGKYGWDYQRCLNKALELKVSGRVIFCDYVKEEHLPVLYNFCEAFVYPSAYEGFGLPVLEAMSCGAAVICSNNSSLPEITPKETLYIDPDDINSISSALVKILEDNRLKEKLQLACLNYSKEFSWKKTAQETLEIYKKI